jgi:hypothetical protein
MAATKEGADRLKNALRAAMPGKHLTSWEALGLASGVSPTTIENWIYARTEPRAGELQKVGEYLAPYTSPLDLSAAYYGLTTPGPTTAQEALERHTVAVERQNELLARLVSAVGAGALLVGEALTGGDDRVEARLRALEAATRLGSPDAAAPQERSSPHVRAE